MPGENPVRLVFVIPRTAEKKGGKDDVPVQPSQCITYSIQYHTIMKTGVTILLVSLLVLSVLFTAGCMSAGSPKSATTVPGTTNPSGTPAPTPPATLPAVSPSPMTTTATTAAPAGTVPIPPAYATTPGSGYFSTADIPDNPWMENLEFSKSYYPFTVPDCVMKALIPETAAGYGIRQPVPALIALTPDRMDAFLQAYPGNGAAPAGSTACAAGPASPNWNFVKISGTILPRNARPSEYQYRDRGQLPGKGHRRVQV